MWPMGHPDTDEVGGHDRDILWAILGYDDLSLVSVKHQCQVASPGGRSLSTETIIKIILFSLFCNNHPRVKPLQIAIDYCFECCFG